MRVNLINVLAQLAAWLSLDLLDLLETARLDESTLSLKLGRKYFGKLGTNVGKNIVWSKLKKGFESGYVSAHLNNIFESLLRLIFKILA